MTLRDKNSRRRYLIFLIVVVVIVAFTAYYWNVSSTSSNIEPESEYDTISQNEKLSEVDEVEQIIESHTVPIDFWGRVVDQNGDPLKDVVVEIDILKAELIKRSAIVRDKRTSISRTTGDKGMFAVEGFEGQSLSVVSIRKEGYRSLSRTTSTLNYYRPDFELVTSIDNPLEFVLVEESAISRLFYRKDDIVSDWSGSSIPYSLRNGVLRDDSANEADLMLIAVREDDTSDWSFTVTATKGSLSVADDDVPNLAPKSGYVNEWKVGFEKSDSNYLAGVQRTIFVKMLSGTYARVSFLIDSNVKRRAVPSIHVRVFINEEGGRILEDDTTNSKY